MKCIKLSIYLLSVLLAWIVNACDESALILSQQQAVVAGNVKISSDMSDAGKQKMEETLSFHSVEIVAELSNPDDVEITDYGILISKVPDFSISQAMEYSGNNLGQLEGFSVNCYSVKLDGLEDAVTYYYRFYVKHKKGVSYSESSVENTFTTIKHERVPDTKLVTTNYIDVLEVKCSIEHDGHFDITECGIYMGKERENVNERIEATKLPVIVAHKGEYVVNVANQGLQVGDVFYCRPFAKNKKGEGKGEIVELKVEKAKAYAKLVVTDKKVAKDNVKLSVIVESTGNGPITEYGYYDMKNGDKVVVGKENIEQNATFEIPFLDLKMGDKQSIYLYAVNADGESPEPDEYYEFMAGIMGKNEDDKSLIYLELDPIEKEGVKYYFLDRNLGATAAYTTGATPENPDELGWLFQYGRKADGHQLLQAPPLNVKEGFASVPEAEAAIAKLNADYPNGWQKSWFIANVTSWTWLADQKQYVPLWTQNSDGGTHNPCPEGYRLPTQDELLIMAENWQALKLGAGHKWRTASTGTIREDGGYFWSCTVGSLLQITNVANQPAVGIKKVCGQGCYVRCVRVEK